MINLGGNKLLQQVQQVWRVVLAHLTSWIKENKLRNKQKETLNHIFPLSAVFKHQSERAVLKAF